MNKKKILVVFGVRPEYIKLFPIVRELRGRPCADPFFVLTGQHRELVEETIEEIGIYPDMTFNAIEHGKGHANSSMPYIISSIDDVIATFKPDIVVVEGDTTSTLAGAISAFNNNIKLVHVEGGLRTYKREPYPEEANRQMISRIADINCCPTEHSAEVLSAERVNGKIYVTGNTEVDAAFYALDNYIPKKHYGSSDNRTSILVTLHRRENIGLPMVNAYRELIALAEKFPLDIVVTKHPNPNVSAIIEEELEDVELGFDSSIVVSDPMDFVSFIHQVVDSDIVITDSGGVQENTSALGVPVIVFRNSTARSENPDSYILSGTERGSLFDSTCILLKDSVKYDKMAKAECPFGDGSAAKQIVDIIEEALCT